MCREKIEIAVIDSGADISNSKIRPFVVQGYNLLDNGPDGIMDYYGHGTNCIDLICQICPETIFYPIKIVNDDGRTSSTCFIEALELCLSLPVKIICVSIAANKTSEELTGKTPYLEEICVRLENQGKIICVSENNNYRNSIPAIFNSTLGVGALGCNSQYLLEVCPEERIQVKADITPTFVYGKNGEYNFFKGTSKANAYISGIVAGLIWKYGDINLDEAITYLKNTKLPRTQIKRRVLSESEEISELLAVVEAILREGKPDVELEPLFRVPLLSSYSGLNFYNFYNFISKLYNQCGVIEEDFHNLQIEDVCTLQNLVLHIRKKKFNEK